MSVARIDKSEITGWGGRPDLYVDEKITPPLLYAMSDIPASRAWTDVSRKNVKNFGECGIHIVCIDANLKDGWLESGEFDPTEFFKQMQAVAESNPQAKVIVRLHLNPPYFWLRKNKEEQIVFYGVESTDGGDYGDRLIAKDRTSEMKVSFASKKWQKDCGEVLRKFCKIVTSDERGKPLIGIQVAYGTCGEWHYFGKYYGDDAFVADYSMPMTTFYRAYLQEKYHTLNDLRVVYGNAATFENIQQPSPQEKSAYWEKDLLNPETDAKLIDAQKCYSLSAAQAISFFCKVIKDACGNGMLAGAFYGYFFLIGAAPSAHYEPHKIYLDDNVDFLAGPAGYIENKRSGNMNLLRHLPEASRLNGKLFLCEMDQGFSSVSCGSVYTCESETEYEAILKRNVVENLIHGNGAWYYDHRLGTDSIYEKKGYWETQSRLQTISDLQAFGSVLLSRPFVKSTDVLVVQDTELAYYTAKQYDHFALINALGKSGAGIDQVYLKDLPKCDLSRYKCVIFANCKIFPKETYDFIRKNVTGVNRWTLFMGDGDCVVNGKIVRGGAAKAFEAKPYMETLRESGVYVSEEIIYDGNVLRAVFKKAGVHVYTENHEVVVADNGMVMVHTKGIEKTVLHLHCGTIELENGDCRTVVYDTNTGERLL